MKKFTKKQWIKFSIAAVLYTLFAIWMQNVWLLLGLIVLVDIFLTHYIPWGAWKRSKNPAVRNVLEWVDDIVFALVAEVIKGRGITFIVDAMSSFGGVPIDVKGLGIDFLVSSANKCIQGVPGFGFILAQKDKLMATKGNARSLSLDIYAQWEAMEKGGGKWRFTSPTHVVHAFYQAMKELNEEGGITARYKRYQENHQILVEGMRGLGFKTLLPDDAQGPIITSFLYPSADFDFTSFYARLKEKGFVIYPGKISDADTFRIGNIGDIFPKDMEALIQSIKEIR